MGLPNGFSGLLGSPLSRDYARCLAGWATTYVLAKDLDELASAKPTRVVRLLPQTCCANGN